MSYAPAAGGYLVVRPVDAEDVTTFELVGIVDEHADLSFMRDLHGRVRLDLHGLRRINSFGVRSWMAAIDRIPADAQVELAACPPQFVDQINMLRGFLGRARVLSFMATYECEACLAESDELVDSASCRQAGCKLPEVSCPECGEVMTPDVIEDLFLRFLRE